MRGRQARSQKQGGVGYILRMPDYACQTSVTVGLLEHTPLRRHLLVLDL